MSEQSGNIEVHEHYSLYSEEDFPKENDTVSAENTVNSLSNQVSEEIQKWLASIRECRKACANVSKLVGNINDSIK